MTRLTRQQSIDRLLRHYTSSELEAVRLEVAHKARIGESPILRAATNFLLDAVKAAQKAEGEA